jgi:hypothetical protein
MADRKADADTVVARRLPPTPKAAATGRPLLSSDVPQQFWPVEHAATGAGPITYHASLLGTGRSHFVQSMVGIDLWREVAALQPVDGEPSQSPWNHATMLAAKPTLRDEPAKGAAFAELPGSLGQKRTYATLKRELEEWLYQTQRFVQWTCAEIGESSRPEETEAAFRERVAPLVQAMRMQRAVEKRAADVARLEKEIEQAEDERSEHRWWFLSLLVNVASRLAEIVVTGLFGRRSRKQVMTAGLWNQAMRSRRLAGQAKKALRDKQSELEKLKSAEQSDLQQLAAPLPPAVVPVTKLEAPPRKSDVDVDEVLLVWMPWRTAADGRAAPAYTMPKASPSS